MFSALCQAIDERANGLENYDSKRVINDEKKDGGDSSQHIYSSFLKTVKLQAIKKSTSFSSAKISIF